jgi:hypothetical protein
MVQPQKTFTINMTQQNTATTINIATENNPVTHLCKKTPPGTDTTDPTPIAASTIHEGGDNTSNLQWGTTGSVSIVLPDPTDGPFMLQEFCIGNQCPEDTDNVAPNAGTERTQYLNRDIGELNGTITIKDAVSVSADEQLCIGSGCNATEGQAPDNEVYGSQDSGGNGPMDGPVDVVGSVGESRGLPIEGSACFGSEC